jgi:hypothetical protein
MDIRRTALPALSALGVMAAVIVTAPSALADPVAPTPLPPPPPGPAVVANAAEPPAEVPHLPSPEYLPPGTVDAPVVPEARGVTYLRELWHAIQTQEVSGSDALLLLTQRPLDAAPPPGIAPGPQPPLPAGPPPAP